MNDKLYVKQMIALIDELNQNSNARPHDPVAYNDIVARCNALYSRQYHQRRRRPWPALLSCICLMIVLLYIVFKILSLLYMKGTS